MRYFMELRYDGRAYCGWQRQNEQPSVQRTIEASLSTLLRHPVEIVGAGRTDTGVHAAYYVAHFDTDPPIRVPEQFTYKLNRILPVDIAIDRIVPVDERAHARYAATAREYRYFIEPRKNPFTRTHAWYYTVPLDIERMNRAAEVLLQEENFTSFAKLNSNNKTNICHVTVARWEITAGGMLRFTIRADRFLRNMVRSIVGTLVDVGRGRYTVEEFAAIVRSRDLSRSSGSAPAEGLYLYDVSYAPEIFARGVPAPSESEPFSPF